MKFYNFILKFSSVNDLRDNKLYSTFLTAEKIKRDLDEVFGHPWNVIVGESFDFDVEYDDEYCYFFFYGPIAVLAYKVSSVISLLQDTY